MSLVPESGCQSFALTWVPTEVLRSSSLAGGATSDADALVNLARSLSVDVAWVPANEPWAVEAAHRLADEGVRPAWAASGVFGRVAEHLGWSEALRRAAGRPAQMAGEVDRALHELLASMQSGGAAGCDLLVIADDLAGASGWMLSPDFALDALMPSYRAAAHAWWGDTVFHSDGDIRALMPSLARAGFAAVHLASLEPAAITIACESAWSAGLVPFGGMPAAALEDAEAAMDAASVIAALSERGPVVVADDGGISSPQQLEPLARAFAAARSGSLPDGQ